MITIHDDIESWLAASVHDQLSQEERTAFQEHLAGCASCRTLHKEEITMSKMIEATLESAKPDLAFEQRIVSGFRKTVPQRTGLVPLLAGLFRLRATQLTAVAAVLLTLVQLGRMVTGENSSRAAATDLMQVRAVSPREDKEAGRTRNVPDAAAASDALKASSLGRNMASSQKAASANAFTAGLPAGNMLAPPSSNAPAAPAPMPEQAKARTMATFADVADERRDASRDEQIPSEANTEESVETTTGAPASPDANRKLIRNAQVELEVVRFDEAVQKITALVTRDRGYIATSSSEKQQNGKLRGTVVVKVLPETLDAFLLKLRDLGEVKNQTLGTDDVTKQYLDTDSRLKNARVMEQRLIEILRTKTGKVSDLLEVEKELGRVREQIEQMQGSLKYLDAQVQFATVTISLAEKEMNLPAAFLLKRSARLALFSMDVEKTFAEVKGVIGDAKAQLSSSTLDRDSSGEATARLVLLIVPEEADALIERIKGMGRVQNYTEQTNRVAQGGSGMSENAKVERDKVELSITISRNEQEPAVQTTSLRILTSSVAEKAARLKEQALKAEGEIRSSSFTREADGQEVANVTLRVPMRNYAALLASFDQLGKVKDLSVHREDRRGAAVNEETAPADISIQVYSQPNIVSEESGLFATIRHTLAQGVAALMWSLRMIGVAIAFLAPWAIALAIIGWLLTRISRARKARAAARVQLGE